MTTENNKLIALFMGAIWEKPISKVTNKQEVTNRLIFKDETFVTNYNQLKYNSDWNQLMEVVEKIENLTDKNNFVLYDINIYPDGVIVLDQEEHEKVSITKGDGFTSKIEMVYNACVEFIKWYNEQKEV